MKREELEKLGLSKEQIDVIMNANGADLEASKKEIEKQKAASDALKAQITEIVASAEKVKKEFEDYKASKMTEEEKRQAAELAEKHKQEEALKAQEKALNEAKEMEKKYAHLIKETKVKDLLVKGGLSATDIDNFAPTLIADTEENSLKKAQSFVDFITAQKTAAAAKAVEDAARGFVTPITKTNPNEPIPQPQAIGPVW